MPFVSIGFIAFITLVALLYFAFPKSKRWLVLLIASYAFFWINSEWLVLTLFVQTLGTFLIGLWIQKIEDRFAPEIERLSAEKKREESKELKLRVRSHKRKIMALGIIFNFGALLSLKYFDFFAGNTNLLLAYFGLKLPKFSLIVPIGLSFYTLQAVSYLVDLRRGKISADRNLLQFMLYMSYFPQIVQGPIPRYHQLAHQLYKGHSFDYKRLCYGAQLILWGFIKKMILADRLAIPVSQVFDNWGHYDGLIVFLAAAGYGLQVYADFSGGIDIARGFSQVIGIELEQNFNQPYFSKSITELWRRWHIALGSWTRDYVFYPLSMSKAFTNFGKFAGKFVGAKTGRRLSPCISTFIAFLFVGFWHGPKWTYVGYGVYNGFFLALATLLPDFYASAKRKLHINEQSNAWLFFQMFRTFIIASFSRFFTKADSLHQVFDMVASIGHNWYDLSFFTNGTFAHLGLNAANWIVILFMIGVMLAVGIAHEKGLSVRDIIAKRGIVIRWLIYLGAFATLLVFGIYGPEYDATAFIYQQF